MFLRFAFAQFVVQVSLATSVVWMVWAWRELSLPPSFSRHLVSLLAVPCREELVLVIDCSDSATSNRKAIRYLSLHSGKGVLIFGNRCLVHQLFRGGCGAWIGGVPRLAQSVQSSRVFGKVRTYASRREVFPLATLLFRICVSA